MDPEGSTVASVTTFQTTVTPSRYSTEKKNDTCAMKVYLVSLSYNIGILRFLMTAILHILSDFTLLSVVSNTEMPLANQYFYIHGNLRKVVKREEEAE
jgi:hypothetical protein